jgi:4-hydroxysphinganine ceramide fatty acyl 2-hydroxylase
MDLKKRTMRIFTAEDLLLQKKLGNCWITRKGRVYDVTKFVEDHPGGDDLITQFSGMDIGDAMENADEHLHSASAYAVLDEYLIGKLGTEALIVSDGQCSILARWTTWPARMLIRYFILDWVADEDFHPDDTNVDDDFLKSEFLDLRKPLLRQVWEANFRYYHRFYF